MHDLQDRQHNRIVRLAITVVLIAFISLLQQFSALPPESGHSLFQSLFFPGAGITIMAAIVMFMMIRSSADLKHARSLADVDELTGLANRRRFNRTLERELVRCRRHKKSLAVMYFDLDRLKTINDCHGHAAGDFVIDAFGKRMLGLLRSQDLMARLSGDEFAAIISDLQTEQDIVRIGERALACMKQAFVFKGRKIYAGASMGAVVIENGDGEVADVMRMADFALLQSKGEGGGRLRIFDPAMAVKVQNKGQMENKLREAIATEAFDMRYQPLVSHVDGRIAGVEALLRWNHPQDGEIAPSQFIPLAEEIGLIDRIGEFALRRACRDMRQVKDIRLAVNISPFEFLQTGFVEMVRKILDETGFEPERLELEISERIMMSDAETTRHVLHRFRKMGVRIALDDFGTGYSSMSFLRDFPLDRIKIDRSFTDQINNNQESQNLVAKMIDLGSTLGVNVTVEGIETEAQLKLLRESACNELQGFLFSKPLTADELLHSKLIEELKSEKARTVSEPDRLAG